MESFGGVDEHTVGKNCGRQKNSRQPGGVVRLVPDNHAIILTNQLTDIGVAVGETGVVGGIEGEQMIKELLPLILTSDKTANNQSTTKAC